MQKSHLSVSLLDAEVIIRLKCRDAYEAICLFDSMQKTVKESSVFRLTIKNELHQASNRTDT